MPYRPTERTERRKARAREAILSAVIDQLAEGGYASATVQAVAARAGVATGTLYRHFPSKAELSAEAFREASSRELAVFAEMTASDGRAVTEQIAAAVEAFARRALAQPTRAYALIAEPVDPAVEAELLTFRRGYRDLLVRALQEGIERGELEPHDKETVAAALVGAIAESLVGPLSPAAHHGRRRHESLVAAVVQFCIDALPKKESARAHAHANA
jgi:AcrR family transcriptional regulator